MADTTLSFNVLARDNASRTITRVGSSFGGLHARVGKLTKGVGLLGPALAGLGIGAVANELVQMAKGAAEDEAAQKRLATQLRNSAGATNAQVAAVEDYIAKTGKAKGVTDDELRPALANLVRATHDVGKAQGLTNLAMDVSRGTGKDLGAVSLALAKAYNGNVGALGRLGIATKDANGKTLTFDQVTKNLATTFKGQASTHANTFAGKMERLQLVFDETKETIGAKLLPVAEKFSDWLISDAIPALERFGGWLEENRYKFGLAFVTMGEAVTGLVKIFGPAMKAINNAFMETIGGMLNAAAKVDNALGGKLGLQKAADNFAKFKDNTNKAFDAVIDKATEWDATLAKTKKELTIKADIQDLETKLKTARAQLADKNLTKTRKAQIEANIADLTTKIQTAKTKLNDQSLVRERRANLRATITDLTRKVATAKEKLDDPKLTKERRARLSAEIGKLQSQVNAAKSKLNELKGKTVTIDLKFTSAGVNLSAPSSVGRRAFGGPGGPNGGFKVRGPGGRTSDQAGLFALSDTEWVIQSKATAKYGDKKMAAINDGTAMVWAPGLAEGGRASWPAFDARYNAAVRRGAGSFGGGFGPYGRALAWARTQDPRLYQWGGTGNPGWDCSGYMGAIANVIRGRSPHSRVGSTATFPWPGFRPGLGLFSVGAFKGNPGHMAGTLLGVNVESRGGEGVVIGSRARGATNSLFRTIAHMATGGRAGDAAFDLLDPRGRSFIGADVTQALQRGVLNRDRGGPVPPGRLAYNGTSRTESMGFGQPIVIDASRTQGLDRLGATWLVNLVRTNPGVKNQLKVLLS